MSTRNSLEYKERRIIENFLSDVCKEIGPKLAKYDAGWDDQRVAEEVKLRHNFEVTKHNVAGIRSKMIGTLYKAPEPKPEEADDGALEKRLEEVEKRLMAEIEKRDLRIAELQHTMARMSVRMDEIAKDNHHVKKRDEETRQHLVGLYTRVGDLEKEKQVSPGLTALGEKLRNHYGIKTS